MEFDVLYPPGPPATADALCAGLEPWARNGLCVLGNMVTSVDGHVTVDGGSTGLGGEGDKAMFHALRGVVDGVLAGTRTVAAETYGRLVRSPERRAAREVLGLAADPAMLLICRSGDVPWDAPLFGEPAQRVGIVTGCDVDVPDVAADVRVVRLDDPAPAPALRALARELGLRSVLCEGGPTLNAALLEAGMLHELCVTVSPDLVGGAPDAARLVGPLAAPVALDIAWVLRAGSEVLLRYSVRSR